MELCYTIKQYVSKRDGQSKEAVNFFVVTKSGTKIALKPSFDKDYGLLQELALSGQVKRV